MFRELRKYVGFIENSIKEEYAYKIRGMVWTFYALVFMFIQYFLWKAIFNSNNNILYEITLEQYISYIGMGLVVGRMTTCFVDFFIGDEIKNGNIAMNLIKPFSFRRMVYARHIGFTIGSLIQLVPMVIVVWFIGGFRTFSLLTVVLFLISLIIANSLVFLFVYFMGIMTFWVTNRWGLFMLRGNLKMIFSGELIAIGILFKIADEGVKNLPFTFISETFVTGFFKWIGYISYALPFQAMYYTPTGIYTGLIEGNSAILVHIIVQIFWLVFFYIVTTVIWEKALKRVSILGG